jgi:hypothetical protein
MKHALKRSGHRLLRAAIRVVVLCSNERHKCVIVEHWIVLRKRRGSSGTTKWSLCRPGARQLSARLRWWLAKTNCNVLPAGSAKIPIFTLTERTGGGREGAWNSVEVGAAVGVLKQMLVVWQRIGHVTEYLCVAIAPGRGLIARGRGLNLVCHA